MLPVQVSDAEALDAVFRGAQQSGAQAVVTSQGPSFSRHVKTLVAPVAQSILLLAGGEIGVAEAAALLQAGPDLPGSAAGAAVFVDRVLARRKGSCDRI